MNYEDFIIPPKYIKTEKWQFGSQLKDELPEAGIALLWVSDYRGAGESAEMLDFTPVRQQLYQLSGLDFEVPVHDFGDLISGKTREDTHYILQEILSSCHYKKTIPVVIGGSNDLSFSVYSALNFHHKNISYTQISDRISLDTKGTEVTENNFLSKIFSSKNFSINKYHHLGYQKHLNEVETIKLMNEVDFDVMRLAEMMNRPDKAEPFLRNTDMVTVNCDAVESMSDCFSIHPQVNGLNRREICAIMKEIGLGRNLKSVGIFNVVADSGNILNEQLLAQMIWYLTEGINIRKSHPEEREFETFWVIIDDSQYAFRRDVFSNLWYVGNSESIEEWLPCTIDDYENAKRGILSSRLLKFLHH